MRFLGSMLAAVAVVFMVFWVGAKLANVVASPHTEQNDFTVGRKMMLCGRVVDTRHEMSGYDFDEWQGDRCGALSELDECLLDCLSRAGTLEIGEACYSDCVMR
jgi:hypothetical protein